MKKVFCALFLAALLGSCGTDNSSNVQFTLDGNGCLVQARNFDWTEESTSATERTVNYRWECASYTSPITGDSVSEKRVTLTFMSEQRACGSTSEIVGAGYCTDTKLHLN